MQSTHRVSSGQPFAPARSHGERREVDPVFRSGKDQPGCGRRIQRPVRQRPALKIPERLPAERAAVESDGTGLLPVAGNHQSIGVPELNALVRFPAQILELQRFSGAELHRERSGRKRSGGQSGEYRTKHRLQTSHHLPFPRSMAVKFCCCESIVRRAPAKDARSVWFRR